MDFSEFMTTFAVCISVLFSGFLVYENERRGMASAYGKLTTQQVCAYVGRLMCGKVNRLIT